MPPLESVPDCVSQERSSKEDTMPSFLDDMTEESPAQLGLVREASEVPLCRCVVQ